jgi:hypothetical protein
MVPPASLGDARAPRYSGFRQPFRVFVYGGLTLCAAASQLLPLTLDVLDGGPTTPGQFPGRVWASPRSLAATRGVSIDFLSYGYLDVSVPRVGSACAVAVSPPPGFPIRTPPDHRVLARSPRLIAGSCVLHRLLLPRHPPHALIYFFTKTLQYPHGPLGLAFALPAARVWTRHLPFHPDSQVQRTPSATRGP